MQTNSGLIILLHSRPSEQQRWRWWSEKLNHSTARIWTEKWRWHLREREGERERCCGKAGRWGGFNRSLWHGGCEMRWWNRRIGRREGGGEWGRAGRREGDCVSKCGCLEIGLPPCQMIKMFPLTFIFPLSGILPMYDEPCVNECGLRTAI